MKILYQTGIRLSELVHLRDIDLGNNEIKVVGKRNKERIVPISFEFKNELKNLLKQKKSILTMDMVIYSYLILVIKYMKNLFIEKLIITLEKCQVNRRKVHMF